MTDKLISSPLLFSNEKIYRILKNSEFFLNLEKAYEIALNEENSKKRDKLFLTSNENKRLQETKGWLFFIKERLNSKDFSEYSFNHLYKPFLRKKPQEIYEKLKFESGLE